MGKNIDQKIQELPKDRKEKINFRYNKLKKQYKEKVPTLGDIESFKKVKEKYREYVNITDNRNPKNPILRVRGLGEMSLDRLITLVRLRLTNLAELTEYNVFDSNNFEVILNEIYNESELHDMIKTIVDTKSEIKNSSDIKGK